MGALDHREFRRSQRRQEGAERFVLDGTRAMRMCRIPALTARRCMFPCAETLWERVARRMRVRSSVAAPWRTDLAPRERWGLTVEGDEATDESLAVSRSWRSGPPCCGTCWNSWSLQRHPHLCHDASTPRATSPPMPSKPLSEACSGVA